jgi:hypothetical protein
VGQEITEYIVRELGRHRPEDEVIFAVARRENLNWDEAQRLVQDVKFNQRGRVARRQSLLLLTVGVGTIIGGLALSGYVAVATLDGLIIFLPGVMIPYLGNVVYFLTGLAMIAGSAYGMGRVLSDALER